jgi:RNA polymerase sigma-70 factor (ECF subfamily)
VENVSDEPDFEQSAREHGPMIRRIAAAHEARPELAEELVQDILFALWRALPAFRGDAGLKSFVARIASNRAASHVARAVRSPRTEEVGEHVSDLAPGPEAAAIERDGGERLMAAVRALPLVSRQVVTLTLEGMGPGEIAGVLGLTANAVSIRLTRAKDHLKQCLGEHQ